jgi:GntR family transcriptional regulator
MCGRAVDSHAQVVMSTGQPTPDGDGRIPPSLSGVPKYFRLKETLLSSIHGLPAGSPIQAERVLCERFGVSRTTVRQALQELVHEGRLYRLQGKGTFVAHPKLVQTIQLTGHTEDMQARGLRPASRLLATSRVPAPAAAAEALQLLEGTELAKIERLRLADGEPMAAETVFLEAARFPDVERRIEYSASLYQLLREGYGVQLAGGEETIESASAGPEDAALLGTLVGAPLLLLHRRTWEDGGRPVEFVQSLYRGDRYRLVAHLQPPR